MERIASLCSERSVSSQSSKIFLTPFTVSSSRFALSTMPLTFAFTFSISTPGMSRTTSSEAAFLAFDGDFFAAAFLAGGVFFAFFADVFFLSGVFFAFLAGVVFLADPFAESVDFLFLAAGLFFDDDVVTFLPLALGFSSHSRKRSQCTSLPGVPFSLLSKLSLERSMSTRSMTAFNSGIVNLYIFSLIFSCSSSSFFPSE
mmetsp:Transcript_12007/g.29343  ORF Transcript_12007/g.29343 Transcript_12007/m.29343 type:complete len:201 (-) Transcript_12007:731-1333(-)